MVFWVSAMVHLLQLTMLQQLQEKTISTGSTQAWPLFAVHSRHGPPSIHSHRLGMVEHTSFPTFSNPLNLLFYLPHYFLWQHSPCCVKKHFLLSL